MLDFVRQYYGETLEKSEDLKTNACCTAGSPPAHVADALALIHDDVAARYYGCGLVLPEALSGCRVVDLGCGSGRDAYLLAQLVGADGRVTGIDMTPQQLAVARRYQSWHAERFGFAVSNVDFLDGYIERLDELPLPPASYDVIVSNCVVNLSPDKAAVLRGAHDLLKEGGELYFADVYADRRVPAAMAADPVLYGECLGGALYWNDFHALARNAGFAEPRLVERRPIEIRDPRIESLADGVRFHSATYRLFNVPGLEPNAEDYGQTVVYRGDIDHAPERFVLDADNAFPTGHRVAVSGNTFATLQASRFARHFEFAGDRSRHLGPFEAAAPAAARPEAVAAGGCC